MSYVRLNMAFKKHAQPAEQKRLEISRSTCSAFVRPWRSMISIALFEMKRQTASLLPSNGLYQVLIVRRWRTHEMPMGAMWDSSLRLQLIFDSEAQR